MGNFFLLFCTVAFTSKCYADISADDVYHLLSGRIEALNTNMVMKMAEIKKTFDEFKIEVETKFSELENRVSVKIETCLEDAVHAIQNKTDVVSKDSNKDFTGSNELKKSFKRIYTSLSAEKVVIREAIGAFEERVEDVEQKMFAFENASWKGERGEPGQEGPAGAKGSKGESGQGIKGQKGEKGQTGYRGSSGQKGQKGSPETRRSVYFNTLLSSDQTLSQNTIVKFDKVFRNQGSSYSKTTGKFTAPYSGVYLFLFFVEAGKDKYDMAFLNLYVNGYYHAYVKQESAYDGNAAMAGNAYVIYMSAGQTAWIQTGDFVNKNHKINLADHGTTFTGVLLY